MCKLFRLVSRLSLICWLHLSIVSLASSQTQRLEPRRIEILSRDVTVGMSCQILVNQLPNLTNELRAVHVNGQSVPFSRQTVTPHFFVVAFTNHTPGMFRPMVVFDDQTIFLEETCHWRKPQSSSALQTLGIVLVTHLSTLVLFIVQERVKEKLKRSQVRNAARIKALEVCTACKTAINTNNKEFQFPEWFLIGAMNEWTVLLSELLPNRAFEELHDNLRQWRFGVLQANTFTAIVVAFENKLRQL